MEFTLKDIQTAHNKYTGPDFPRLIQEFKRMGMVANIYDLSRGMTQYVDKLGNCLESQGVENKLLVADSPNVKEARAALRRNQAGTSDFPTFCQEMAEAGVCKWISDLEKMTCSYFDLQENAIIIETIPSM